MANGRFPDKDADFNDYLVIIVPYLVANAARLGLAPTTLTILTELMADWVLKYPPSQNPDTVTKTITEEKAALRNSIETQLRIIYDDIPKSRLTLTDRNTLNLPARDTTPTARPAIGTTPQTTIQAKDGRKIQVSCRVASDSSRSSRHKDSDGVEYRYTLAAAGGGAIPTPGNPVPAPTSAVQVVDFSTKAVFVIQLADADAGKVITVQCRWKNTTDPVKSSSWSNPAQTMVTW